jgi:hypothetical protein
MRLVRKDNTSGRFEEMGRVMNVLRSGSDTEATSILARLRLGERLEDVAGGLMPTTSFSHSRYAYYLQSFVRKVVTVGPVCVHRAPRGPPRVVCTQNQSQLSANIYLQVCATRPHLDNLQVGQVLLHFLPRSTTHLLERI